MKTTGIHHVAIICFDYERSKRFYTEVLGFQIIQETFRAQRNSYKLDLRVGENQQIELFSFPNPPPRMSHPEACGLRHLAFEVDDIDATVVDLQAHGVEVENIRIDEITGQRFTFFADPDNLPLEIYEREVNLNIIVREYRLSDTKIIMNLFFDTIREVNIKDYTIEQVNVWAPDNMDYEVWHERLQTKLPYVAEINHQIVGFAELEADGHIDCFYCHSKYQRVGIGSKLLSHIETIAKLRQVKRLYTEASITAMPFFQSKGFRIVNPQQVQLRGVIFQNYVMEKYL